MAMIALLPGARLFCAVLAILSSVWEHLTFCCLRIVRSLLIVLRYGEFGPIGLIAVEVQCM